MIIHFGQDYTVVRVETDYYISPNHIAPQDAEIAGASEILRAKTDYKFEVDTDPQQAITDQYGTLYELVIDKLFKAYFIAQLPPYISQ